MATNYGFLHAAMDNNIQSIKKNNEELNIGRKLWSWKIDELSEYNKEEILDVLNSKHTGEWKLITFKNEDWEIVHNGFINDKLEFYDEMGLTPLDDVIAEFPESKREIHNIRREESDNINRYIERMEKEYDDEDEETVN